MKPVSARRTRSRVVGRGAALGHAHRTISVRSRPPSSAPSARAKARARPWFFPSATWRRWRCISPRYHVPSHTEIMPSSSWTKPAGTPPPSSPFPPTSRSSPCRPDRPNSTRTKTSGSSCAITGSPTASSSPTTIASITVATLGTNSSINLGRSCPSATANGHIGHDQRDLV